MLALTIGLILLAALLIYLLGRLEDNYFEQKAKEEDERLYGRVRVGLDRREP